ncbi:unnamed protein product [Rotaria sp. Silwood2]|nr:unnamed protein product [Rotaria sp. Silwood2]
MISTDTDQSILRITTKDRINNNRDDVNIFRDIFDIIDGNDDTNVNDMDYNKYHTKLIEDFNQHFNFDLCLSHIEEEQEEEQILYENDTIHEKYKNNNNNNNNNNLHIEDDILSTRLSQLLSTNYNEEKEQSTDRHGSPIDTLTTLLTTSLWKRKKIAYHIDDNEEQETVPNYLLSKHRLFDQIIQQRMDRTSSMNIENLRQLAFFRHQIVVYERLYHLWSIYLQSGTGQLNVGKNEKRNKHQNYQRYWPKHVKSLMMLTHDKATSMDKMTTEEDQHVACELLVQEHIRVYQEKLDFYKKQFNEKRQSFISLPQAIEKSIEKLIEHYGLAPIRMKCHLAIAILHNNYEDLQLQYEYEQEKPTDYQIEIARHMYEMNCKLEKMKSDFILQRLRILYNKPPTSYDKLQIDFPTCLNLISNRHIQRQQFIYRYETLIQQTKTDLMTIRLAAIEANIYQYEAILNNEMNLMLQNHHRHVKNKEMTQTLIYLIDQRLKNVKEKMKVICNFHINYDLRCSFGHLEEIRKRNIKTIQRIGFSTHFIVDYNVTHHLNQQQLQLLNRGPTYVAPCQIKISSSLLPSSSSS